jgi:hypothetical protein
MCISL